ncbi:AMP-binding protein [Marinibaculum pumilum]|uniref:AMP-binding protein n=1 Tax=Marinibaculum pumilum TaxID=1766165 RepID=A0ABV7L5D6_9PROT
MSSPLPSPVTDSRSFKQAPFRHVDFLPPKAELERRADGSAVLRSAHPLGGYDDHVLQFLERWAAQAPDRPFLCQRTPAPANAPPKTLGPWRQLSYAQVWQQARAIGQGLLSRGLQPGDAVMILSGNSLEHALLTLGTMAAGLVAAPVSPAYSLLSSDLGKLRHALDLIAPKLVFAQSARQFRRALSVAREAGAIPVHAADPDPEVDSLAFETLAAAAGPEIDAALAALGPDTVAKYLLTSGSTGMPKAVINTHRMMCANQAMAQTAIPPDPAQPPVILDWLPWNHTYGGNMNFNGVMSTGGTLYIDDGRPTPDLFWISLQNLREIAPTSYLNVPVGFGMLIPVLEEDEGLARHLFSRLKRIGYGGAALSQEMFDKLHELAVRYTGERIIVYTGWGSTETAPTATSTHWASERSGLIGLPYPGVELKLVPAGEKLEIRVRGPIVTPGYLNRPDLTEKAFDEEGFYRIGDAARFVDPDDPDKGLVFDGRVVEDFKLDTGTWVSVGPLRVAAVGAAAPVLQDAVVTGHDRPYIGLLAWPSLAGCREVADNPGALDDLAAAAADEGVARHLRRSLATHNAQAGGSSMRVRRVLLMSEPPLIDAGEITDKGYVNQRAVLGRRNALAEALYAASGECLLDGGRLLFID